MTQHLDYSEPAPRVPVTYPQREQETFASVHDIRRPAPVAQYDLRFAPSAWASDLIDITDKLRISCTEEMEWQHPLSRSLAVTDLSHPQDLRGNSLYCLLSIPSIQMSKSGSIPVYLYRRISRLLPM